MQNETYDATTGTFTVSKTGLYWFHLSAGVPAQTKASYCIAGISSTIGIIKDNTAYQNDQVTTDGLSWITSGTNLRIMTNYSLFSSSLVGETAWLWFRLDTAMQQLVAFYVIKTQTFTSSVSDLIQMTYDKVIINEGNGWKSMYNLFEAPISGYYFISYGIASIPGKISCLQLITAAKKKIGSNCIYETSVRNGVEVARAAVMVYLNVSATLASYVLGNFYYNGGGCSNCVYMQGFLYSPYASPKVAWSVIRKMDDFAGPLDTIQFDDIQVNEGSPWNKVSNVITIPRRGLYFIDLTTYLGNAQMNKPNANMQVLLNNSPVVVIQLDATGLNNGVIRSRSIMAQFSAGDTLRVAAPTSGSYYISNSAGVHVFTGFLLYTGD